MDKDVIHTLKQIKVLTQQLETYAQERDWVAMRDCQSKHQQALKDFFDSNQFDAKTPAATLSLVMEELNTIYQVHEAAKQACVGSYEERVNELKSAINTRLIKDTYQDSR